MSNENKLGRPLSDSTSASGHIHLRVTMDRKNAYVHAARLSKQKLSEWMVTACDKEAASNLWSAVLKSEQK